MQMKMEHGLSGPASVIDHHPVPFCIKTFVFCNFSCGKEKVPDKLPIGVGHALNIGNVLFRNNQRVNRRLGIDVFEGGDRIVLVNDFRGNFFFNDLAEDAVGIAAHAFSPSGPPEKLLKKQLLEPV